VTPVNLESSPAYMVVPSALYKDGIQHELDTVTLIQFEAPEIPAASFSITENKWFNSLSDTEEYDFKVAGRRLSRNRYSGIYTFDQLIENVRKRKWSCFILGAGNVGIDLRPGKTELRFVLVTRWKADQVTA
jgi:hypothetical protein